MSTRTTLIVTLILISTGIALGIAAYGRLPEQMASHWNIHDQVDGYTSRFWGVSLMPMISITMLALFLAIPAIDPLKANIAKFREAFNAFIALMIAFLLYVQFLTLAWNLGFQSFKMSLGLLPAVGLILIFAGLMMRSAKRNYFIGIRTPWTLSSDKVWDQTHRVGSWLFIGCGLLAIVGALLGGTIAFLLMFLPLMGCTLFLLLYSYVLYQRETKT